MGEAGKRDSGGGWGWIGMERTKGVYPLVNIQKAIENDHRNSGFTH
jgi:hypothetical protein